MRCHLQEVLTVPPFAQSAVYALVIPLAVVLQHCPDATPPLAAEDPADCPPARPAAGAGRLHAAR